MAAWRDQTKVYFRSATAVSRPTPERRPAQRCQLARTGVPLLGGDDYLVKPLRPMSSWPACAPSCAD
jgi:hypothetical protein